MDVSKLEIRWVEKSDYNSWLDIYRAYAEHYEFKLTPKGIVVTWSWLMDEHHPLKGLCCVFDNKIVGLAHYREIPSSLEGKTMGFLDDLIVHKKFRRNGIAERLLKKLQSVCQDSGWITVWWVTKEDNYEARKVYDKVARKTDWALYEMDIG